MKTKNLHDYKYVVSIGNTPTSFLGGLIGDEPLAEASAEDMYEGRIKPILVVLPGGADINPALYYQKPGKYTHFYDSNDARDLKAAKFAIENKIPILGICRGAQLLTAMVGGKLIQHVENHVGGNHLITSKEGDEISITSCHHQMMYPFDLGKDKYDILYWATPRISNIFLDGDNKEISLPNEFVEPEIVHYPYIRAIGIQGHPEWMHPESVLVNKLKEIINNKLLNVTRESSKVRI